MLDELQITFLLFECSSCFDQQHKVMEEVYFSTGSGWQKASPALAVWQGKATEARTLEMMRRRMVFCFPIGLFKEISRKVLRKTGKKICFQEHKQSVFSSGVPLREQVLFDGAQSQHTFGFFTKKKGMGRHSQCTALVMLTNPFKKKAKL